MHRVMWRQVRVSAVVMVGLLIVMISVGVESYNASGGVLGMRSLNALLKNPAISALAGRVASLNSAGAFVEWKMGMYLALAVALWAGLLATRLTRASEDEGTWDYLALSVPGRRPAFWSAVAVLGECCALVGVVVFVVLVSSSQRAADSLLYALVIAGVGWTGASLGLLGSQLFAPRRSATQVSLGTIGLVYLVRMMADGANANGWLRWFSPFGWLENTGAFGHRAPVWLVPMLVVPAVLIAVAYVEQERRDVAIAVWTRADRSRARVTLLASSWRFAWRERRSTMVTWALGLAFFGLVVGYLTNAMVEFTRTDAAYVRLLNRWGYATMITAPGFIGQFCVILAVGVSFLAVTLIAMIGTDLRQGRLDIPFANGGSRSEWLGSGVVSTLTGIVVVALVCGASMWAGVESSGTAMALLDPVKGMLNAISTVPLLLGLTALLVAWWPRFAYVIMASLIALWYLVAELGPILHWPTWLVQASPFHYLRIVPVEPANWPAVGAFVVIGAIAAAAAFARFATADVTD